MTPAYPTPDRASTSRAAPSSLSALASRHWRLLGAAALSLWLAGCAGQTTAPSAPRQADDWQRQQSRLEALDTWTVAGKVGLRTPRDSTSANLDWTQTPQHYRMLISGPFGTGRSVLEGRAGAVELTTGDGTFQASSPEALMQQQLGWSLPISALDYWVRGLPAPGAAHDETRDDLGFPAQLRQAGWTIAYRDWTYAGGLWLPRRLVMTYDDIRALLVVNEWQPGQADTTP
ncbi:lipoprotein insertase outer membrane protein LolB [Salinicola sp. JS01]|uniref:lipoprotein insertase outer membrane protein LolB n=1 Tax=Salinicola sp. JS01 TaxID=3050071 RepID=UPI00255B849A|nr:lipoprotein insertase outer membrane protein LolB [Salinicola sp. JS01]WIX34876.1 lipoprotein insertase outer membrane protein LolB [Salinicola sp. JS01]